ncbi:MAG: hypothetical protein AAFO83_14515 [Cyanobacteria bacterium J06607_13]
MGRWGWLAVSSVVIPAGVVGYLLATQSPGCACGPDTQGQKVRPILLAQRAFYLEHGQFATQQELEAFTAPAGKMRETNAEGLVRSDANEGPQTYRVERIVEDFGEVAVVHAVPEDAFFYPRVGPIRGRPKPTYHSAVGAVRFDASTKRFDEVVCVSDVPMAQKLPRPRYVAGRFSCPAGTLSRSL